MKIFLTIIVTLLVSTGCKDFKKIKTETSIKRINYVDSFTLYNPSNLLLKKQKTILENPKFIIYAYMNVSCSSCLAELNQWQELCNDFVSRNTEVKFICYSKDEFEYFKFLCEDSQIKKLSFPYLLDNNDFFIRHNSFIPKYQTGQVFLTNNESEILCEGDLLHNIETKNKFLNLIKNEN